jgi:hypothetical protein
VRAVDPAAARREAALWAPSSEAVGALRRYPTEQVLIDLVVRRDPPPPRGYPAAALTP